MSMGRIMGSLLPELLRLPRDMGRRLTVREIMHIFETCEALWRHNGDEKMSHAGLTSGLCSNGFVSVPTVLQYTPLAELFADQIVRMVREVYAGPVNVVVGSDHASATLSYAVAVGFRARHDFTEKGEGKTQRWSRLFIRPDEVVLQVEELITTLSTTNAVRTGVRSGTPHGVNFVPLVATLVDRMNLPGAHEFEGSPIISIHRCDDIKTWQPEECPLCAAGSERINAPKQNWAKLTGAH